MNELFDVLVIGGGVVGSAVARELSRYRLKTGVLEKNPDLCFETSGRNSAVCHGGFTYDKGSLRAKLCVEGNRMMGDLSKELGFRFLRCGKIFLGETPADREALHKTIEHGRENGVPGMEILEEDELRRRVPAAPGKFGLFCATSGILDPFEFTLALAENAVHNGVRYYLSHEVTGISRDEEGIYTVRTPRGDFRTRWLVNSAGLGAKKISDLLGITGYRIVNEKCDYILLDKKKGPLLPMPIYHAPLYTPKGVHWGTHLTNTIGGSVLVGPYGNTFVEDTTDYSVQKENIDILFREGNALWPHIERADYIRTYAGTMPKRIDENGKFMGFTIEIRDEIAPRAVNLIGIESPGLTAAAAIARYAVGLMKEREDLPENDAFDPVRKPHVHFCDLSADEQAALIAEDPDYGELVCRCEKVTKAEVLRAIRGPLGASTMIGVKYRTHAMMGRCQGGYCQMRIERMLEEERGLAPEQVHYGRGNSPLFFGKVRKEAR